MTTFRTANGRLGTRNGKLITIGAGDTDCCQECTPTATGTPCDGPVVGFRAVFVTQFDYRIRTICDEIGCTIATHHIVPAGSLFSLSGIGNNTIVMRPPNDDCTDESFVGAGSCCSCSAGTDSCLPCNNSSGCCTVCDRFIGAQEFHCLDSGGTKWHEIWIGGALLYVKYRIPVTAPIGSFFTLYDSILQRTSNAPATSRTCRDAGGINGVQHREFEINAPSMRLS